MQFRFQVVDWWAWSGERASRQAWIDWALRDDGANPSRRPSDDRAPIEVPMNIRRRLGPLLRLALAHAAALDRAKDATIVTCSRHGDFQRTMRVIDSILGGSEVSPTDFALSVHNGLAGVLSLVLENRNGHTAVAAGPDSFAFGLLEALSVQREAARPALLLFADEPMPSIYAGMIEPDEPAFAAAFVLDAGAGAPAHGPMFELEMTEGDGSSDGSACQAECFLRAIIGGTAGEAGGARMGWRARPC